MPVQRRCMFKRLAVPFLVLMLAPFGIAGAQTNPDNTRLDPPTRPVRAVLELFTSQGCSSCPPADKLLKSYVEKKDIMALSLPVDYWDYIGWKDTFASPKNTQRQRAYSSIVTDGPIYTPQMIINGRADALGSSPRQIDNAIANTADAFAKNRIGVQSWYNEHTMIIQIGGALEPEKAKQATIWLARIQKVGTARIKAGENRGRDLNYYNVVREMTPIGTWTGRAMTIRLARQAMLFPETEEAAILVQEGAHGPIIGAGWLGS
jgi:hypothetical protein